MSDARFFRATALCAFAASVLVLLAQYGLTGYGPATTAAEVVAVYAHPVFRAQSWVILVQVFLMFLALWGVTLGSWRRAPGLVLTAFLFAVFWQVLELLPRSYEIFGQSYGWAPSYLAAESEPERAAILASMREAGAVLDGLGHLRRFFWCAAHLLFGLAFVRRAGVARVAGVLFLFNAARLMARLAGEALGHGVVGFVVGRTQFVVGMVPLFLVLGWWLWTEAVVEPRASEPVTAARTASGSAP